MDNGDAATWLPLAEASQRLGVTVDSLRKQLRRGLIDGRKGNDGRVTVRLAEGQGLANGQTAASQGLDDMDDRLAEMRAELAEAQADVERWRATAEERGLFLARAEAALDAERRYAGQLEAMLAELRKPWWRRLLG